MSNPIGIATKCVTTFLDFLHIVETVNEYSESDPSLLQVANVINRTALFIFSSMETLLMINSSNNPALTIVKTAEVLARCINLTIQVLKGRRHLENETKLRFLERAVLSSIADISITAVEGRIYTTRRLLNQLPTGSPLVIEYTKQLKTIHKVFIHSFGLKMLCQFRWISSYAQAS